MSTTVANRSRTEQDQINHKAITAVVCLALATVVAAMTSLNVALPEVGRATGADETQLTWIVDAYSLFFAALLLPAGALGDRFGRRVTLLIGLCIFGAGSVASMLVDGANGLIALRAVLGLGAALVMPATLSTITGTFAAEHRAKAVSIWAGVAGASAVLGVLASGLLLEAWSWRSIFVLNIVLATVAIVGTLRFVPESADPAAPRLDWRGALVAGAGLVVLVYSIIEAPTHGWTDGRTLGGFAAGLVVLTGFVLLELRITDPMLDPRIFARRRLSAGTLSIFVQFFAFFGFIFLFLQYLQLVRGDSALVAAVSVVPMAATLMPTSRLVPKLVGRVGARRLCSAGLTLLSGGLLVIAQVDASSSYWLILAGLLPIGAGMGLAMTPATTAITESLPAAQQGVGSAMNDLARELGGALGIAVVGSVLSSVYRDSFTAPTGAGPSALLDKAKESFVMASHAGGPVGEAGRSAFVDGMHAAVVVCSLAALAAAVLVGLLMPGKTRDAGDDA